MPTPETVLMWSAAVILAAVALVLTEELREALGLCLLADDEDDEDDDI